ncbi:MAG: hypothetical protein AB9856_12720 [Cellulosilyticaceae bacterium]
MKEKYLEIFQKYKAYILTVAISSLVVITSLLNMSAIQVGYYRATDNKTSLVNVLSHDITREKNQDRAYFEWGVDYLLGDLTEESKIFLEENFQHFKTEIQQNIIITYNKNNLFFKDSSGLIEVAEKGNVDGNIREYIKRMPIEQLELGLQKHFEKTKEFGLKEVQSLYNIISAHPQKLPLNKYKINIYSVLELWSKGENKELIEKLLDYINPKALRTELIKTLKIEPIEITKLNNWIQLLNKKQVFTTKEYANFTTMYNESLQLKEQLKQLKEKEVDIQNLKATTEVEIEKIAVHVNEKANKMTEESEKIKVLQNNLAKIENYENKSFYILDYYGEGEYEAAVPKKSKFFNTHKPSNEKVVIKLNGTIISEPGVVSLKLYNKGTKAIEEGKKTVPYYVEISEEDKAKIQAIKNDINQQKDTIAGIQGEIAKYEKEIEAVKVKYQYNENLALLEEIKKGQDSVIIKLKEKQVQIQILLGIGNVIIEKE